MPINKHAVELGVLVGVGNLLIFQHFMPPVTDVRSAEPFNTDIDKSEREALIVGVAFTTLAAGFVKSFDTFIVGGAVLVALSFAYKHANAVTPETGKMAVPAASGSLDFATAHPLSDYAMAEG